MVKRNSLNRRTRRSNSLGSRASARSNASRARVRVMRRVRNLSLNQSNSQPSGRSGTRQAGAFVAAAYSTGQKVSEPIVKASPKSTRIVHRELLSTVTGSVAFAVFNSFQCNPGLSATFPWLSTQAVGWEQYKFHKLAFEYITRCATTAAGSVILAPDYDVLDAAPSTELIATSYRDATEDVPWKEQCCVWEPTAMFPLGPRKYVRSALVANSDLKTYDVGTQHICTTGQVDTAAIGKLWVAYDVELFVPQTSTTDGNLNRSLAVFNLSTNQTVTTATATTVVYDETVVNNLGIVNTSGVFTLPLGNWLITVEVSVSGGTVTPDTLLLEIEKDNAAQTIPVLSRASVSANAAPEFFVSATSYLSSTGSNTTRARITYTNGTGTLVARGDSTRIILRLV